MGNTRTRNFQFVILLYSGLSSANDVHQDGLGLTDWVQVSERIITAQFTSKFQKVSIIECYIPANQASQRGKENFCEHLHNLIDEVPKSYALLLTGDMNANLGATTLEGR